jgi:hypothetical protein
MSRKSVAQLYERKGWKVCKASWTDYEILSDWAELIVESEAPILLHGCVADLPSTADELLSPLREAGINFVAEHYGPPPARELLMEWRE